MNRAEFMRRLTELLGDVAPTEREEAIQYYNDYFDDAGEENESGVIASLGTPEELARTIKAGLNDGGNGGEFTESGFSGYTQTPKDEIVKVQDGDAAGRTDSGAGQADAAYSEAAGCGEAQGSGEFRGTQSGSGYYEGAYYKRPEGDGVYGGRQNTGNYRNPYEESGSQENTSYEQSGSYGTGTSYGQGKAAKEPMSGGMIALIVVLAVLTSPVWIGLLGGFLGVAAGLIAVLFALFLTFLIIGVVFIVVAIRLLVTGVTLFVSVHRLPLCV